MKNNFFRFDSIYSLENIDTIQKLTQLYKISLISIKNKGFSITKNKNFIPVIWLNKESCFIFTTLDKKNNYNFNEQDLDEDLFFVKNILNFVNNDLIKNELLEYKMNNEYRFLLFEFLEEENKYLFHGIWNITETEYRKGYINNFCKKNYHFLEDKNDFNFLEDIRFIKNIFNLKSGLSYIELYDSMVSFTKENFKKNNLYNLEEIGYNINNLLLSTTKIKKNIRYNNINYSCNSSYLFNKIILEDKIDTKEIEEYLIKMSIISNFNNFIFNKLEINQNYSIIFLHDFNFLKKLCINKINEKIININKQENLNINNNTLPIFTI